MHRACLLSALIVIITGAANAAPTSSLSGSYGVTGISVCILGPPGAHFTGLSPPLGAVVESLVVEQKQTFTGSTGTGTANFTEVIGTFEGTTESLTFTTSNTINADGTWTSQPSGISGTANTGSHAGQTFTVDGFPALTGYISPTTTLIHSNLTQQVETIAFSGGDVLERICAHSRVLAPLP